MKRRTSIYKTSFLFITMLFLASCDDFLDLEPETSLSSAVAFDNITGIEAGMNGIYSTLHSDWVERQLIFSECLASTVKEVNPISNANYAKALRHQEWNDLFNAANYLWSLSFSALNIANEILLALPKIEETNAQVTADKTRLQGEALFIRGLTYFVLNRFFADPRNGLSVPLLLEPFQPGDEPFRATSDAVKAQIIEDLKAAESLMQNITSNNGRVTIWGLRGFMARVYFEYEDYTSAETYANNLIENGPFSLIDEDVAAAYSTNVTSENVFTFLSLSNDRAANNLFDRFSLNSNNVQLSVSDPFWDLISSEEDDLRLTVLHEDFNIARACHKYDDRDMNIPYIRLPEIYLIRAESSVNNGKLDDGLADLNRLRQRAGLSPTDYTDEADLLEKIFTDRSLELSMEGDHFHNLKRLKRSIGGYPWEEAQYKLVFFIPETEILLNPNLIQNDFW